MLTKNKKDYLKRKGKGCLYCGTTVSKKLGGLPLPGDDVVVQVVTCDECGKSWKDVYTITDIEDLAE